MFALIRNLIGRRNRDTFGSSGSLMSTSLAAATTLPKARAVSINPTPCPARTGASAAAVTPARAVAPASTGEDAGEETLSLPLAPIINRFPDDLRAALIATPSADASLRLPRASVIEQLSRGAVRFPLGFLRQRCSEPCFAEHSGLDETLVTLPLDAVLAHLTPIELRRRPQQVVTVPDSVIAPFGGRSPVTLAPVTPVPPSPAVTPTVSAAPETTPAPVAAPKDLPPAAAFPAAPPPVAPAPAPTASSPYIETASAPARRETSFVRAGCLTLPLNRLANGWPAPVLQELANQNLAGETVELPLAEVEAGLKQGRLAFTWRQIRAWTPAIPKPLTESALDSTALELPLRFVAPLFLAHKPPPQRRRAEIGEGIPNLFGPGSLSSGTSTIPTETRPVVAAPAAPAATVPAPAAQPMAFSAAPDVARPQPKLDPTGPAAPAVTPAATPQTSFLSRRTIDVILEEPGKTNWTPMEIVRKVSQMRGVAGATMATQDGLMVAEQYPALVGTDTFCALTTQLFNRVFNTAMELRLGGPARLSFVAESVTYEIHRCGRLNLTVISQPGEKLPSHDLTVIAEHLINQSR
jgi:predicted regulator of Ras-like GTPase activity (Roadblock/LC7/MglB family)